MALINTTNLVDSNDGELVRNPDRVGNRRWGTKMFLSGTEVVLPSQEPPIEWVSFESITVSTTALTLTENLAENFSEAMITVEAQAIRFRLDGQAPTATVGHEVIVGGLVVLSGFWEMDKFQAIRRDGADATIRVSYGKRRTD